MNKTPRMLGFSAAAAVLAMLLAACTLTPLTNTPVQTFGIVGGSEAQPTLMGLPLDLSAANITLDGAPATAAALRPGVEIVGEASRVGNQMRLGDVEVRSRVKGQLDGIFPGEGSFGAGALEVVGVRVELTDGTHLVERLADGSESPIALADLAVDDYLEIYGAQRPQDETVIATRIVRKVEDHPERVELRLRLRNLDSAAMTFSYGMLTHTVDYSNAEVRGELHEGAFVRVRGDRSGTTIVAERVRGREQDNDDDMPRPGARIEIEGPVMNLDATAMTFELLHFLVDYSNANVEGELAEGVWVEVHGTMEDALSPVVARRVEVEDHDGDEDGDEPGDRPGDEPGDRPQDLPRQEGPIEAIDPVAMTVTVAGRSFWADSSTRVELDVLHSSPDSPERHIPFDSLMVGDWLEIAFDPGNENADGLAKAVKIEVKPAPVLEAEIDVEGTITGFDAAARTFELGTVRIVTSSSTEFRDRRGGADIRMSADDFFAEDRSGEHVKVEGRYVGGEVLAREVTFR